MCSHEPGPPVLITCQCCNKQDHLVDDLYVCVCVCVVCAVQDMIAECQELLTLFGLPFITAPAEAEAQCAWLEAAGLVDGVVTDDTDAFLFGAQHIYRHMFEDKK